MTVDPSRRTSGNSVLRCPDAFSLTLSHHFAGSSLLFSNIVHFLPQTRSCPITASFQQLEEGFPSPRNGIRLLLESAVSPPAHEGPAARLLWLPGLGLSILTPVLDVPATIFLLHRPQSLSRRSSSCTHDSLSAPPSSAQLLFFFL